MPWLADLVESSEGSFSVLPVQCLCEFLLNDAFSQSEDEGGKGKKRKAGELLVHAGDVVVTRHGNTDVSQTRSPICNVFSSLGTSH